RVFSRAPAPFSKTAWLDATMPFSLRARAATFFHFSALRLTIRRASTSSGDPVRRREGENRREQYRKDPASWVSAAGARSRSGHLDPPRQHDAVRSHVLRQG